MFLFFDTNGVLKEIINDLPLRQGSDLINRVYVFIDRELPSNVVYSYKYKKPNGEVSESIIFETTETKQIPFNRHRDLYYFKYGKDYKFNYFDIPIDALTYEGMISFTISVIDGDFSLTLEIITLNIEEGIVAITESITQSQFTYLMEMIAEYKQLYYDRIDSAESDIEDILDGTKYVYRAWKDRNGEIIHTHYATKNELDSEIVKIVNGTTLVNKTKHDQTGEVIDETYLIKSEPSYNDTTNKLSITTKTQSGSDIKQDITLPKASDTKDGLMSKEHKIKLTDLPTENELDSGTYQVGISKKAIKDIDGNAIKDTYIKVSEKGQPNGVAPLNAQGEIAKPYLPASAFDIEEHDSLSEFPSSELAETGKIYIALDTNLTYRWSGTQYVEISKSLALGETELTAYRGDKGKIAYDHSQEQGNPHATESKDIDYDNTESGLESEKVQSAIDELADKKAEITYVDSKVFTDASYVDDELGKKLDKTTFEAYEIDTSETIDNKADYDGYYATLHAGVSDQLASPVPQIDTQEYLFRTSGGTADLGSGIAKIKSLKGKTEIVEGEIKNISIDAIKTVGFNLFNGEYAKVVKADDDNNGYQLNGAYDKVYFNTIPELDGSEIELTPSDNKVYPSENGYLFLTDTDETTCISIVWSGWRVDDSEEYWEEERLIETTDLFPNGMNGIGEIYDEITDTHKIQRFKVVDLGELDWKKSSSLVFYTTELNTIVQAPIDVGTKGVALCNEYELVSQILLISKTQDKVFSINEIGNVFIYVNDFEEKTALEVKGLLSGVYMVYALNDEITTPHDKRLQYVVDDFGTEEFILAQQSLQIPIKHKTSYLENLRDKLRRLPSVSEVGSLSDLQTESKVLVGAINEVKDTKQDKVVDTGWLELTLRSKIGGYIKYRKIDNRVFWRVALQLPADENDWGGATYIYALPSGNSLSNSIRPIIPIPISLSTSNSDTFGSSINHAAATLIIGSYGIITIYTNRSNEKGRYLSGEFSYFLD